MPLGPNYTPAANFQRRDFSESRSYTLSVPTDRPLTFGSWMWQIEGARIN